MHAQEEARLLDHDYIGTEHLLLGLAREGDGVGPVALEALKISLTSLRQQIETVIGRGTSTPAAHIPFSRRAKTVLELSLMEALQLRHDFVGTEHLLLGIVREGEGVAARMLIELGADRERVRTTVMRLLEGAPLIERAPSFASVARTVPVGGLRFGWIVSCALCGREQASLPRFVRGARELICLDCIERAHDYLITTSGREGTLPPLVEGDTPTPTAAEEVLTAFTAVYGGGSPKERDDALEDGAALGPLSVEVRRRFQQAAEAGATLVVQRVRFRAAGDADVFFAIMGVTFAGRAVHVDGRWKVSRETWCHTLTRAAVRCPPRASA